MKVPCNTRHLHDACCKYYLEQGGYGLSPFRGPRYQRGSGIIGDLFRSAVLILKEGGKKLATSLLKTGLNVLGDISRGKNWKEAAKERLKESGKELLTDIGEKLKQAGQGKKRKAPKKEKKAKRTKRDIFS